MWASQLVILSFIRLIDILTIFSSISLLSVQYARSQLENLGAKPYTQMFKHRRANRMIREFPTYNKFVVQSFSEGDSLNGDEINR